MEKTKIQPIIKSKTIDYGDKEVNNFWLKINEQVAYSESDNLAQIISSFHNVQDSVICIQTEELAHPEMVKTIFNASKKRNRIYIITNQKDEALKQFEGICLIRFGIKNIGSFVLINPNSSSSIGIIFTASFTEPALANIENIVLKLDNDQVKTLFRFFSDNFWNKTEHEILDGFETSTQISEPPLDFLPNMNDFCDSTFVKKEVAKINSDCIISIPVLQTNDLLNFSLLKKSAILTSLKFNNQDLIKELSNNENSIYANPNVFKRIILNTNQNSWLIPKTIIEENDNLYAIKLNKNQIEKLSSEFSRKIENVEFQFHSSKKRKELVDKTILKLDELDSEISIKSQTTSNLKDIELNEFFSKEKIELQESDFIDDTISCKIEYKWNINPFYLPQNAKNAKFYEDWQKIENEFQNICNQLEKSISESENKNITEKLKRFFLGKKQSFSKYNDELNKLKTLKLSELEISKRNEKVKEFNNLIKNVSLNIIEIETEIKKSEIENEIEKLNSNLELKKTEFEEFVKTEEQTLKEKEDSKQQRTKGFLEKHEKNEEELASFKAELIQKAGKKNRKINPKDAENAQKILDELQDIEGFNFRNKFEDEKKKLESEIKKIEQEVERKEKEKLKIGTEKDQETSNLETAFSSKDGKSKNHKSEFIIPENLLQLPKVGELREQGNQKFLAIEFWEDYEIGKQETERFNAKLCAKP